MKIAAAKTRAFVQPQYGPLKKKTQKTINRTMMEYPARVLMRLRII
jgi:hypothetical protein